LCATSDRPPPRWGRSAPTGPREARPEDRLRAGRGCRGVRKLRWNGILADLFVVSALVTAGCAAQSPAPTQPAAGEEDFHDPFENTNRAIFDLNQTVDRTVLVPVAKAYRAALPDPIRDSVRDFLYNLNAPLIFANDVLQGHFDLAKDTLARFVLDSTIGMGGLVDVAGRWGIPYHEQDLGITLGVWGVAEGPYIVIPILGPSDPRDLFGLAAQGFGDPWNILATNHHMIWIVFARGGVAGIDQRSRLIETLADIERTSLDYYATIRSIYRQRRAALIHRTKEPLPPNPSFGSNGGAVARANSDSARTRMSDAVNGLEVSR
jgi:phospholipid-binding lipoprotein MlaA